VPPGNTQKILIVEDEPAVRDLMRKVLEKRGLHVELADDGEAGLEYFQREGGVDLVVSDIIMPGISGAEMVRRMMQLSPGLKVLFVTAFTQDIVAEQTRGLKFEVLRKPFGINEFAAKVRLLLGV
jgi:two-component system cell cycle sensor histidine kinase/response regulator CckA